MSNNGNSQDYFDTHRNNPVNVIDEEEVLFESNNLSECLDYAKETKDFEPIENAIMHHQLKLEKATSEIQFLIDLSRQNKNDFMAKKLIKLRNELNK